MVWPILIKWRGSINKLFSADSTKFKSIPETQWQTGMFSAWYPAEHDQHSTLESWVRIADELGIWHWKQDDCEQLRSSIVNFDWPCWSGTDLFLSCPNICLRQLSPSSLFFYSKIDHLNNNTILKRYHKEIIAWGSDWHLFLFWYTKMFFFYLYCTCIIAAV